MLMAWFVALLPLPLAGAIMLWISRVKDPDQRWKRFGIAMIVLTVAISGLTLYWLPPPGARETLMTAARGRPDPDIGNLSCDQAKEGVALLKRMTNDRIVFREPDKLLVDGDVWFALGTVQRDGMRNLAGRHARCAYGFSGKIEALDLATEQPLP